MTVQQWESATLYEKGALRVPRTLPQAPGAPIGNPSFEQGDTLWDKSGNWAINNNPGFRGNWCAQFGGSGTGELISESRAPVNPGQRIRGQCYIKPSTGSDAGRCRLYWFDINGVEIVNARANGSLVQGSGAWRVSVVDGTAPSMAASVAIGVSTTKSSGTVVSADEFSWNYGGQQPTQGLMYKAVQEGVGLSGANEPAWPGQLGQSVVDNEVTWEAVAITRIVWRAEPIMVSGAIEPAWATGVGDQTADNTISWSTGSRAISDPKCPHSPYVVIQHGKVYAGDDDIAAFCATNSPRDWSAPNDAGYIPFGTGSYGSNPIKVMGLYRGNLMIMNSIGFQLWQIDPDPALNNRIDSLPVGSEHHRCFATVANDALMLTARGVRSVGVAAASSNIETADVGSPVDTLVRKYMLQDASPRAFFSPSGGEYFLLFRDCSVEGVSAKTTAFVFTVSQLGKIGSWSRYRLPFYVDAHTFDGDVLLMRSGDDVFTFDEESGSDDVDGVRVQFTSWFRTHFLQLGQIGQDKTTEAFDIATTLPFGLVGNPEVRVSLMPDQRDPSLESERVQIPLDTVPDYIVPLEVTGPSIAIRVEYTGGPWQFDGLNLYYNGMAPGR